MSDASMQTVGARLSLLNGPAFRSGLQAATDALAAFNDEQERAADLAKEASDAISDSAKESSAAVKDSASTATDAVTAQAEKTTDAADAIVAAQGRIADAAEAAAEKSSTASDAVAASQKKVRDASVEAAGASEKGWTAAVAGATKILKWGSIIGAVVGYEGVKKYLAFNQQISQMAIDAGVKQSQLPAFANTAIQVSNASGLAATSVGDMMYRIASANPKINATTKAMQGLVQQAGNLYVMAGNTGDYDSIGRMYGAIVSNQIPLTHNGPSIAYNAAGGKSINEWALATVGHGDMKTGDLVSALGTGILPLAKTFGLSLNEVGAALDVLSPAMNASSAATRLKTAFGMIGSPSQKASEAYELFGGNATTAGSILRSKGLGAFLSYLSDMVSGRVTGSTFTSAYYGGGLGSLTGGEKGVGSGAGEYLRVLGFTPAQGKIMEGPGGVSAFASMSPAQLRAAGFAAGTTGAEAVKSVEAAIIGGMFGGGHTGAAIMQLLNEQGTYSAKLKAVQGTENPANYGAALKLAYNEPIVTFHQLEQQFDNLTIKIGNDVTPALEAFGKDLLAVGQWFGRNKWALEALGVGTGTLLAGAGAIKAVSIGEKIVSGVKYLFGGSGSLGSAGSMSANTGALTANTGALEALTSKLTLGTGAGGLGTTEGGLTAEEELGGAGLFSLGGKTLGQFLRGAATKSAVALGGDYLFQQAVMPTIRKHTTSQEARSIGDVANGAAAGAAVASFIPIPGVNWAVGGAIGGLIGGLYSLTPKHNPLAPAYNRDLAAYRRAHPAQLLPGERPVEPSMYTVNSQSQFERVAAMEGMSRAQVQNDLFALTPAGRVSNTMGVNATASQAFISSITSASKMQSGSSSQDTALFNAEAQLIAAAVKQKDAADHGEMSAAQLKQAATQATASLAKLLDASDHQESAANNTNASANSLKSASNSLEAAALQLVGAAANAASALSAANVSRLADQGTRAAVARK